MTTTIQPRTTAGNRLLDPDQAQAIKSLIAAVVLHAQWEMRNAESRQRQDAARQWLQDESQVWIDAIVDIHPDHVRRWIDGTRRRQPRRRKQYRAAASA